MTFSKCTDKLEQIYNIAIIKESRGVKVQKIVCYRLLIVTYGLTGAPFLAVRSLKQAARNEGTRFPEASQIILRDFYMDDLLIGTRLSR